MNMSTSKENHLKNNFKIETTYCTMYTNALNRSNYLIHSIAYKSFFILKSFKIEVAYCTMYTNALNRSNHLMHSIAYISFLY